MEGWQFNGVLQAAANMPVQGERGTYTRQMFAGDFPQFLKAGKEPRECLVPEGIFELFVENANQSILPSRYGTIWRYAAGLYVAHFCTLYLKTYSDGSPSAAKAAAKGQQTGLVKEATMGDTTISYDNEAVNAAMAKWGSWNATQKSEAKAVLGRQ